MRTLSPSAVANVRAATLWSLRVIASVAVFVGAYLLIHRVLFATLTGDWNLALKSYMGIGNYHPFHAGVTLTALGVALGLGSRPLASWIVAVPPQGCPRCGYAAAQDAGSADTDPSRCTECGLSRVNERPSA